jgi:hypothetical protein
MLSIFLSCNTRIGLPWTYWEHGICAVVGGLAVCFIILLGLASFAISTEEHNRYGERFTAWGWGTAACIAAGLLLQVLPHTSSGVQFLPVPPWSYAGKLPAIISVACWVSLVLSLLLACGSTKTKWDLAVCMIFIAFGINTTLSLWSPSHDAKQQAANEQPSSTNRTITEWEKRKAEHSETLEKLQSDKEMLIARIKSLGVRSKQELMSHPVGRPLVEELEQLNRQIAKCKGEVQTLEAVIENGKSKLRILERQDTLHSTSDEQFKEISETGHELEAELRSRTGDATPGSEVQQDKMLDELFQDKEK